MDLLHDPLWLAASAALLGLLVGSFLNVVVFRLPLMIERQWRDEAAALAASSAEIAHTAAPSLSLARPRSYCPLCRAAIAFFDNVPLLSYIVLRGRCRTCGGRIPWRYPLLEALCALLFAAAAWRFGPSAAALGAMLLLAVLLAASFIDLETQLLPDDLTLPLLWAGLLCNSFGLFANLAAAVWGAALGYLLLWAVYWLFKLTTGREGMGYGDFKLLAALGAWFGWQMLPLILLLSASAGTLTGVAFIILTDRQRSQPLPFGPWLALAGGVALFWGWPLTYSLLKVILGSS